MELINRTPYPAGLFRTVIDDKLFAASVLARVTYELTPRGLVPSAEQVWQVSMQQWKSPYGLMEGDEVFCKGGVDCFVFGSARPEGNREAPQVEVVLEVGTFRRRLLAIGDRVWQRSRAGLTPSPPKPFREMPLTLDRAFGGKAEWDGLEVAYPFNQEGKGFYLEEAQAVAKPLPNLEDPDQRLTKWSDQPEPVVVTPCPMPNGLRLRNGLELDEQGGLRRIKPTLFNAAHPRMIAERVQPGDRVRLSGVTGNGPLAFTVPPNNLLVRLTFDDEVYDFVPALDEIGIEVDRRRVFLAWRQPFRYVFYPQQKRSCELLLRPESAPPEKRP
jgi:hypothetical protein